MNGTLLLYLDQHGQRYWAKTVKELRKQIGMGSSRIGRMHQDMAGKTVHCGYVIGDSWLTAYRPVEIPQ